MILKKAINFRYIAPIYKLAIIMKNIYKYIPYDEFELTLHLNNNDVYKKLLEEIETDYSKRKKNVITGSFESKKQFEGTLAPNKFEINRLISNRNSFLPNIKAEIIGVDENTTIIKGNQKIELGVMIFGILWMLGAIFALVITIIYSIINKQFDPKIFIPLIFVLGGYGLIMGSFIVERNYTREFFKKLFPELKNAR